MTYASAIWKWRNLWGDGYEIVRGPEETYEGTAYATGSPRSAARSYNSKFTRFTGRSPVPRSSDEQLCFVPKLSDDIKGVARDGSLLIGCSPEDLGHDLRWSA